MVECRRNAAMPGMQKRGHARYYGANAKRGTFSATFFLACLAALELEGVVLEEI
jgi:hypothetical protein